MFADLSTVVQLPGVDVQLHNGSACSRSQASRWLDVACELRATASLFRTGRSRVLAISDSPGVLSALRARHPSIELGATKDVHRASTRSWGGNRYAKLLSAVDAYRIGLARRVHVSGSRFTAPAVARSVCLREVLSIDQTWCPSWARTFLRDLPKFVEGGRHRSHFGSCIEPFLDKDHPCKGQNARECHKRFVAATCAGREGEHGDKRLAG